MSRVNPIGRPEFVRAMPRRMDSVRKLLDGLIRDRKLTLSEVSERLGKNHAYMQQFMKRGIPERLPERVRLQLAEMLDIDETLLGAPLKSTSQAHSVVPTEAIPEFDIRAGAAYGGGTDGETDWQEGGSSGHSPIAKWGLPPSYVRTELGLSFDMADILAVRGDSMDDGTKHGLSSGDRVVVDRQDRDPRQGGIFAVWDGGGVIVKQVELVRDADPPRIICKSLNVRYAPIEITIDGNAHVIGRIAAKIARM